MRQRIPHYRPGDYLRECDVCGFEYYRSELRKRYDGAIVCFKDYEKKHERDRVWPIRKERPFKGD
jgi:formylmethanofuran dehydrogenase subunit E